MIRRNSGLERPGRPSERRGAAVGVEALDIGEIVPSANLARSSGTLTATETPAGMVGRDPARHSALALARAYTDDLVSRDVPWRVVDFTHHFTRARYYYRVAMGLEKPDDVTGEA